MTDGKGRHQNEHVLPVATNVQGTQGNDKCYSETTGDGGAVSGRCLAYLPRFGGA